MKTVCISISKEVENINHDTLEKLFPELAKVLKDGGWILDDLQIL